jgi:hypothetical protein
MALGILELVCTVGLIVPAAFHWQPVLTAVAATVLAIKSLVFVWVHAKYGDIATIILSRVLGLLNLVIEHLRTGGAPITPANRLSLDNMRDHLSQYAKIDLNGPPSDWKAHERVQEIRNCIVHA